MAGLIEYIFRKSKNIFHQIRVELNDYSVRWKKNIIHSSFNTPKEKSRALCVFAHYSSDHIIHECVVSLVGELKAAGCDVLFVSASGALQPLSEFEKIKDSVIGCILRENFGYDFGSWKAGVDAYPEMLCDYKHIVFANDSVYGPFGSLRKVLDGAFDQGVDIWALTDSYERQYHYQSYFWGLSSRALRAECFNDFWGRRFKYTSDRFKAIRVFELRLHHLFVDVYGLKGGVLYPVVDLVQGLSLSYPLKKINPTHQLALELLTQFDFPFVKRELLLTNPKQLDALGDILMAMKRNNSRACELSRKHLDSLRGSNAI